MMNWPDNKRIAVMMAFDLDAQKRCGQLTETAVLPI